MLVLGLVELTPLSSHPAAFIELLGCEPRDYTPSTIAKTWFRRLSIYEISRVRLRLIHRCCRWGLLHRIGISGSCWIGGLCRTWVTRVGKSGQQMVLLLGPSLLNQGDVVAPNEEEIEDWMDSKTLIFAQEESVERWVGTGKWIGVYCSN